jgi:dTDP-4-dehydrorhamnose reductase
MNRPRLIIIGSNGFLGTRLTRFLTQKFENVIPISRDVKNLNFDLNNLCSFDFNIFNENDFVIFLAAISSPDFCSNNFQSSYKTNVVNTINFIDKVINRKAKLIFASSDVVYGNINTPANEEIVCSPIGEYATMKYIVERFFFQSKYFKSIRLSNIFSMEDKFISYIYKSILSQDTVEIYKDFKRNSIYFKDVLDGIESLINNWNYINHNAINFGGPFLESRKDIFDYYCQVFRCITNFNLISPDLKFYHNRPICINLDSGLLESIIGRKMISTYEALLLEKSQKGIL